MQAHLALPLTTIATGWRVTRTDGNVYGFTDHDRNCYVPSLGLMFAGATGYTPTDVASKDNLDTENLEIVGILESPSITEDDLRAGLWDHAEVKIFQFNWADLSMGIINMRIGHIGEVTVGRQKFRAEILGLTDAYKRTIGQLTSAACRNVLGDANCGVDLAAGGSPEHFTQSGTVGTFDDDLLIIYDSGITIPSNPGVGKVTFTGGLNAGLTFEARSSVAGATITLQLPPPYAVANGDTYTAVIKCTKDLPTCRDVFNNVVNFNGEPYLQGNDKLAQVGRHS